ncbi:unnamed protein product [Vicia faba]|uniref:Uncharacterized protein n=1 Tax=Vicia faba TaxID=3906 RepID=A0AAV1A1B1_VICFA|nr:unnamed protein product [Vicia faba]
MLLEVNVKLIFFYEPKPDAGDFTFMDVVREKRKDKTCDEENEKLSECSGDSSDESERDLHFNDSEEVMNGFDEGVGAGVDGEPRTENVANS